LRLNTQEELKMAETMHNNRSRIAGRMAGAALTSALLIAAGVLGAAPAQAQSFKVLYTFESNSELDGTLPIGNLLPYAGSLYGTTYIGGGNGAGTVFQVDIATGQETLLYHFGATDSDGLQPFGGLVRDAAGNFYGDTYYGGSDNKGTLFEITPAGKELQLHSFRGPDGASPLGSLVRDAQGNLYGVTISGGAAGLGTVFKLNTAGQLTTLHAFAGPDGEGPGAGLLLEMGELYGVTYYGGAHSYGTVFQVNPTTGTSSVLYSFIGGPAGGYPVGGLVGDGEGNLFGTGAFGGTGYGVVFQLNLATREETVLHTFTGTDGSFPESSLVRDSQGNLYGTTYSGGAFGYGTVFKLDTAGSLTTLYSFDDGKDGGYPLAGLVLGPQGKLYGAACGDCPSLSSGDPENNPPGAVFEIMP
jgi:uncharacterized repeat protein (TIGR03803 family)